MKLWTAILAGLQILASGSVLMDITEARWVGLFSLLVAAMQGGTAFYLKSDTHDHQAKHAHVDPRGR